jgi:predicted deacetylase
MLPRPVQYLLRFDDLCPTVSRERWRRCRELIAEFGIRPILAVVPDNQDPALRVSPAEPGFWESVRAMESAGAAIGLHGYRHLCSSRGRSLVPLHSESEFAGVAFATQREWIREGLRLLRAQGLNPRIWVAPRHGFDAGTLRALREEGIEALSDGFARAPFTRAGLMWIPQQLWGPAHRARGVWTICLHPNSMNDAQIEDLHAFLRHHRSQLTDVDRVLAEFSPARLNIAERIHAGLALARILASRARKHLLSHQAISD